MASHRTAWLTTSLACALASGGAACAFELADVVSDGPGVTSSGDGGSEDGSIGTGGGEDGSVAGDGGGQQQGDSGSPTEDAGPRFIEVAQACSGGRRVAALAVTDSSIYAVCTTAGFRPGTFPVGTLVRAPRNPGAADGGSPFVQVADDVAPVLLANQNDVFFGAGCGVHLHNPEAGDRLLSPALATSLTAALLSDGVYYFAGLAADGITELTVAGSGSAVCGGDAGAGCAPAPGCTIKVGRSDGTSTGLTRWQGRIVNYTCSGSNLVLRAHDRGGDGGALPAPLIAPSADACPDVPLGAAALDDEIYFPEGDEIKRGRVPGASSFRKDDRFDEGNPVTLLTIKNDTLLWVRNGVALRRGGARSGGASTLATSPEKVTALLALSTSSVMWGSSSGKVYQSK